MRQAGARPMGRTESRFDGRGKIFRTPVEEINSLMHGLVWTSVISGQSTEKEC